MSMFSPGMSSYGIACPTWLRKLICSTEIISRHAIDVSTKMGATYLSKLETLFAILCTDISVYILLATRPFVRLPYPFRGRTVV
jgi:hypothetical protein